MRVLQIEDDPKTARSVEMMLSAKGHECETTAHGEDALRILREREKEFDLILLDIMLPDIDGYEVLKRLQSEDIEIPVLIQSGLVSDEADRPTLGVFDSLLKPFGPNELEERMQAATERAASESRAPADNGEASSEGQAPSEEEASSEVQASSGEEASSGEQASSGEPVSCEGEKRRAPRSKIIKGGRIIFNDDNCVMDCLIVSLSDGGAAIQPQDQLNLPDNFRLEIKFGPTHDCEVCWRHANKLGVKFLDV